MNTGKCKTPDVIIGNCCLYHGDALKLLPDFYLSDCIVTDPPYLLESGGCTEGGLHERFGGGGVYGNSGEIVPCDIDWKDFMRPCFSALRDPAQAYFMSNNRNVQAMLNAAEEAGFHFHNLLVWDKISATPNRWYMKNCEFVGFFSKGNAFQIKDCSAKQLIKCPQVDESKHPTEKPVSLMESYIKNSTLEGETVLDPFMGSGTTGVAALRSGRKFVGIEKDEKFFNMAVERIRNAHENLQGVLI